MWFTFIRQRRIWLFHVAVFLRTAKKCTKNYNARAQPLLCSLRGQTHEYIINTMRERARGNNRPFPSSLVPLFQDESKCETFHMKMSFAMGTELVKSYCGIHVVECYCKESFLIQIDWDISFHHIWTKFGWAYDVITWLICICKNLNISGTKRDKQCFWDKRKQ